MIAELLKKAGARMRREGRPDPKPPSDDIESRMRDLISAYAAELRQEDERASPSGTWIFQHGVDHDLYVFAAMELVREAQDVARWDCARAAVEVDESEDECGCRCRKHRRAACPICLVTEKCQVHAEAHPGRISPRWRREHGE